MLYDVIQSSGSLPGLIIGVNKAFKEGWKPIGGIGADQGYYFQAICKEENIVNSVMQPQKQEHDKYGKGNSRSK